MHYKVMCFVMLTQLFVKALDLGLTDSPTGRFLKKNPGEIRSNQPKKSEINLDSFMVGIFHCLLC